MHASADAVSHHRAVMARGLSTYRNPKMKVPVLLVDWRPTACDNNSTFQHDVFFLKARHLPPSVLPPPNAVCSCAVCRPALPCYIFLLPLRWPRLLLHQRLSVFEGKHVRLLLKHRSPVMHASDQVCRSIQYQASIHPAICDSRHIVLASDDSAAFHLPSLPLC